MKNKNILVVAAMDIERNLLVSWLTDKKDHKLANGAVVVEGLLDHSLFYILLSGIGKVNAAISVALSLEQFDIDLVINSGVAGGLLDSQNPGDRVIAYQATYHDVDVTAFGYAKGQLPGGPVLYKGDEKLAQFLLEESKKTEVKTELGLVVSGDQFINQKSQVALIKENFPKAVCVEMEAAAIAQTAHSFGKPFVIIRALSDKADSDAKHDYGQFVATAADQSANLVRRLVQYRGE